MKQTPQDKAKKQELLDLIRAKNRALSALSFKHIKTYEDFLASLGHNRHVLQSYYHNLPSLSGLVTREDIIAYFKTYETELEQRYAGVYDNFKYEFTPHEYEGIYYDGTDSKQLPVNIVDPDLLIAGDVLQAHETLPESELQTCQLFAFQERAASALYYNIIHKSLRGQLLRAAVGTGKTFIVGAVIRRLLDIKFTEGRTYSPWPIVYVTKASIVDQTERVLRNHFGIDTINQVKVINIEQLRATFGELMVRFETVVVRGEEEIKWVWRPGVHPLIIFWDESQILKNTGSQQSQIAQAYNEINTPETFQVHFSATPFMRVCEAKCFCVSTRIKTKYGVTEGVPLSNESWPDFESHVAHPDEPEEYSPAAIKRLMERMAAYVVDVKGVRPQFNAINSVNLISFRTEQEYQYYADAWTRYEEARKKIEGYELSGSQSRFLILAQFTIFRKAAELCRAEYLADAMYESVMKGEAACLAVNFKGTIRKVVYYLHTKYGIERDDISLIWGGGKTKKTDKQKKKEVLKQDDILKQVMSELGMTADDFQVGVVQDYEEDKEVDALENTLRLGIQSKKDRQKEIDRFQSGKSRFCMFTFKAGGVGLSLHHTDEMTREKVRRKPKSNWAVVEDIPKIPTRPRVCFLAPTFSAIELVQGLGRCPRLTSLSNTVQIIIFYKNTIEERVAALVNQKLKCLKEVVRTREDWQDVCNETKHNDTTVLIDNNVTAEEAAENTAALFASEVDEEVDEEVIEV